MITFSIPRLFIASHKGGAGKTLFTLGILHYLKTRGYTVTCFKKGPDYIDAGWLRKVSGRSCRNLDMFLFDEAHNLFSFYQGAKGCDIAVIEGNRGLFDGMDFKGSCSSSRLAYLLKAPIILVLDCTKVTRSLAALVKGFLEFEEGLDIRGVILNKIARERHANVIRNSIEYYTGVPVLGVIYKLKTSPKERHLGLVTSLEYEENSFLQELLEMVQENCDWERILKVARSAPQLYIPEIGQKDDGVFKEIKVAVFRDPSFQFYYPENLDELVRLGAELVYINAMEDSFPEVDCVYLGGGFPELQAEKLAANEKIMRALKEAAEEGMPIYAECGGFMYLGKEIEWKGKSYPMCGVLPFKFVVDKKPQGHGYVIAKVVEENPYFDLNQTLKGHEFHYSKAQPIDKNNFLKYIYQIEKGFGIDGKYDGVLYKNVLAGYLHIHAYSVKNWAENFLKRAKEFKNKS